MSPQAAQLAKLVLRLEGEPAQMRFIERVTIKGLKFAHTEWYFPSDNGKPGGLPGPKTEAGGFSQAAIGVPGVLFTGPRGEPITRALLSSEWQAARTAANAPEGLRIHDLRHHAATLTARMPGITTKELMARIGHASPRAALIYQHATEQRDREIAAYLDQAIPEP